MRPGQRKLLNEQLADVTVRLMAHWSGARGQLLKPIASSSRQPCNRLGDIPLVIGEADASAARVIADAILDAFGSISSLPPVSQKSAQGLSWLLSGLVA